jgi:aspartyl-tRNA(Asn)/glutamyl-tRNA(Gln) amidotransferase subunit C
VRLTREEVKHIALLARVSVTDEEADRMREQLSTILENFEILRDVDTADVPPTAQSIVLQSVVREDEITPSLPVEDVLSGAPRREGGFFKVNAVLEE